MAPQAQRDMALCIAAVVFAAALLTLAWVVWLLVAEFPLPPWLRVAALPAILAGALALWWGGLRRAAERL